MKLTSVMRGNKVTMSLNYESKENLAQFLVERIARLRMQNNLSQRELSLRIGKESSYINRLEQRKFIPSVETLCGILEECGSSLSEIFYPDMEQYAADTALLNAFKQLSKEKKELLIKFLTTP